MRQCLGLSSANRKRTTVTPVFGCGLRREYPVQGLVGGNWREGPDSDKVATDSSKLVEQSSKGESHDKFNE